MTREVLAIGQFKGKADRDGQTWHRMCHACLEIQDERRCINAPCQRCDCAVVGWMPAEEIRKIQDKRQCVA